MYYSLLYIETVVQGQVIHSSWSLFTHFLSASKISLCSNIVPEQFGPRRWSWSTHILIIISSFLFWSHILILILIQITSWFFLFCFCFLFCYLCHGFCILLCYLCRNPPLDCGFFLARLPETEICYGFRTKWFDLSRIWWFKLCFLEISFSILCWRTRIMRIYRWNWN